MKTCIAIRTHKWGAVEEQLALQLSSHFGEAVKVAFHNRPADLDLPYGVADFDDTWVKENGLRILDDYGWRCGDYPLFALRQAFPDYDRYWLIEPDVAILGDVGAFFDQAEALDQDALGVDLEDMSDYPNRFTKGLGGNLTPMRATYALVRFSGESIDYLFEKRRDYCAGPVGKWRFTNDEIFSFSYLNAHPDFTLGRLGDLTPEWFEMALFDTDPDILDTALARYVGDKPQICHPVRPLESLMGAVSDRVAQNAEGFLRQMRLSLGAMSEQERAALIAMIDSKVDGVIKTLAKEGEKK